MKNIYVLLSRTDTVPAKVIRRFTTGEFSHTSVSLYPRTDRFYSFARRKLNNPLIAGFISESIHTKVFAKYPNTHCAVLCIPISDEGYKRACRLIRFFVKNRKKATYSFLSAITMKLGLKLRRKYKYTCSQFVATVLYCTGDIKLPKDPCLMLPNDFLDIESATIVYDGMLQDCVIEPPAGEVQNDS